MSQHPCNRRRDWNITVPVRLLVQLRDLARQAPDCSDRWGALHETDRLLNRLRNAETRRHTRTRRRQLARLRARCQDERQFLALAGELYPEFSAARIRLEMELFDRRHGGPKPPL